MEKKGEKERVGKNMNVEIKATVKVVVFWIAEFNFCFWFDFFVLEF